MGCVLLGLPIFTGCRGCHHFLGACVVATWVCRVYEVLSVSLGLVLILCVNALVCQCVGNVEFVGCCWRIPGTITITGTMCICTNMSLERYLRTSDRIGWVFAWRRYMTRHLIF